jgi:thiamine-phosphate pyrophosphorylase
MPRFHLHLITDRTATADLPAAVGAALEGGVDWVQIREKTAPAQDLYEMALSLGRLCRANHAGLMVNDRADVALAAGASGVHLARRSLPVSAARAIMSPGRLVGLSVHTLAEAVEAEKAGADYVTFGSVFPTRSHPGQAGQGVKALAEVVRAVNIPVLAIGGITGANLQEVLATGCAGIAIISAILIAPSPREAAAELRSALDGSAHQPRVSFPNP